LLMTWNIWAACSWELASTTDTSKRAIQKASLRGFELEVNKICNAVNLPQLFSNHILQ
jgi:hypothetical protein